MNFYLTGSSDGFNALRFPNVEDWQNCMGHTEGISKWWDSPCMEYVYGEKIRNINILICRRIVTLY